MLVGVGLGSADHKVEVSRQTESGDDIVHGGAGGLVDFDEDDVT